VFYNQAQLLKCIDHEGTALWRKRLTGYLYSDIMLINDRLIFITAGQGGAFYSIDPASGNDFLVDRDVIGTQQGFDFLDDKVVLSDRKGCLKVVNPFAKEAALNPVERLCFKPVKLSCYSPVTVLNRRIYTIGFDKESAFILCIAV
jgi:hypothetical protein